MCLTSPERSIKSLSLGLSGNELYTIEFSCFALIRLRLAIPEAIGVAAW